MTARHGLDVLFALVLAAGACGPAKDAAAGAPLALRLAPGGGAAVILTPIR